MFSLKSLVSGPAIAVVLAGAALATSAPAVPASSPRDGRALAVTGDWVDAAPCIPASFDPATGRFSATCSSIWTGTWIGVTKAQLDGTTNLLTGDTTGTIDETFIGRSDDGGTGTLRLRETLEVDGNSSTLVIDATIVQGTGDFRGSRGHVTFTGLVAPDGQGAGMYSGRWVRPRGAGAPRAPLNRERPLVSHAGMERARAVVRATR
jgi:hypothetical protein